MVCGVLLPIFKMEFKFEQTGKFTSTQVEFTFDECYFHIFDMGLYCERTEIFTLELVEFIVYDWDLFIEIRQFFLNNLGTYSFRHVISPFIKKSLSN